VDQAAVEATVSVLIGMDIDEAEGRRRRLQDGIEIAFAHSLVGGEHAGDEVCQVYRSCADELRQRIAGVVALAEEDAVRAQPRLDEARVFDQDAVQAVQLLERERILPCLQYGAAPAFEAIARRAIALDLERGAAVGQQQEARGAGDEMRAGASDCFGGLLGEAAPLEGFERFCTADNGAVVAPAEQVVADAVPLRKMRSTGEIRRWVERVRRSDRFRVLDVERRAGQSLAEEPGAAGEGAGRRRLDEGDHFPGRNGFEGTLQDQQVNRLMAQCKGQVVGDLVAGPVAFVEDRPAAFGSLASLDVSFGNHARSPDRGGKAKALDERRPTGQPHSLGNKPVLERRQGGQFQVHGSNPRYSRRK